MIITAKISRFNNGKFVLFIRNVVAIYNHNPQPTLAPFLTPLSDALVDLNEAYQVEQKNRLTEEIQELDTRRDAAIKGLKKVISGYFWHYDATVRDAAKLLIESMDKYSKQIDRLDYLEETSAVFSLIDDWTNDPLLSNAITTLNLLSWQQELATVNTDFDNIYLDRVYDEAAKKIIPVTKQREPVTELYLNLERKTVAYNEIDPVTYTIIIDDLNELITKYNESLD